MTATQSALSAETMLRTVSVIFAALISGVLIFLGIVTFLVGDQATFALEKDRLFQIVVVGFCAVTIPLSVMVSRVPLRQAQKNPDTRAGAYMSSCIVRWAMIEGPALLSTVLFLVTRNQVFLCLAGLCLAALLLQFPSKARFDAAFGESPYQREALLKR